MTRLSKFIQSPFAFKLLLAEAFLRLSVVSVLIHVAPRSYCLNRFREKLEQKVPVRLKSDCDDNNERSGYGPEGPPASNRNQRVFHRAGEPVEVLDDRANAAHAEDICKAVVLAARYVPGTTCLVQSITGRAMLRRAGCVAELKIGVLKDSSDFQAHAWLENHRSVLLGGEVARYTRLVTIFQVRPKP
jgi:hypothetical protein